MTSRPSERPLNQTPVTLHAISVADLDVVATLHCASWRSAYRGILSEAYLEGDLLANRLDVWHPKLSAMTDRQFGWIARHDGEPVGFAFASIDRVDPSGDERAPHPGLFLWCYERNTRARAFYERQGAEAVEQILYAAPDGQWYPEWRYAWRTTLFAP